MNAKVEVKFLTGTVENQPRSQVLSCSVGTGRRVREVGNKVGGKFERQGLNTVKGRITFLYGKGVAAWMRGDAAGKRKEH